MNKLSKNIFIVLFLFSLIFSTGCVPKRIVWNSSGTYAAVLGDEGELYIADPEGNITDKLINSAFIIEWFDDNKTFLTAEPTKINTWSQATQLLPEKAQEKIKETAQKLYKENIISDWKKQKGLMQDDSNFTNAVKVYIRDNKPEKATEEIIQSWKTADFTIYSIKQYRWQEEKLEFQNVVFINTDIIWDIQLSPDNSKIAFTHSDNNTATTLSAINLKNQKLLNVDTGVSMYPDWSADGKSLIYGKTASKEFDNATLGTIKSVVVCDNENKLVDTIIYGKDLANVMITGLAKVCCLDDGSIIFSSLKTILPVTPDNNSDQPLLFMLEPDRHKSIVSLITKNALNDIAGYDLNFFEVSPDNKYISFIDHDSRVAVLEIATGKVTIMQGEDIGDLESLPSWRSSGELSYFSKNENGDYIAIHKPGEPPANMSINWTEQAKADILN